MKPLHKPFSLTTALLAVPREHHADIIERAAVYQYDGGLCQEEAERRAFREFVSGAHQVVAPEEPTPPTSLFVEREPSDNRPSEHVPYKTRGLPQGEVVSAKWWEKRGRHG